MKLLMALILFPSLTYAQYEISCFNLSQHNGQLKLAYKLRPGHGLETIRLSYPKKLTRGYLTMKNQCLVGGDGEGHRETWVACLGLGQHVRNLIPVDIEGDGTVYCEKSIFKWFFTVPSVYKD